jgi:hypothetical protein
MTKSKTKIIMEHLEFNNQNGVIVKENLPIGIYSKHKNVLVLNKSYKFKNGLYPFFEETEVIDYVLDEQILTKKRKLIVKYTSSLDVSYMTNEDYTFKSI